MGRSHQAARPDGAAGEPVLPAGAGGGRDASRPGPGPALVCREAAGAGRRGGFGRNHRRHTPLVSCAGPVERGVHPRHAGAGFHLPFQMNLPASETASRLIPLLASLMVVFQLRLGVERRLSSNLLLFALQSLLLTAIAAVGAYAYGAWH